MDLFFFVCVDVNVKNNGGRNALHYAAIKGWLEIAQLYFKSDEEGKDGQTREHALLAFTLGVKQMICCCNKFFKRSNRSVSKPTCKYEVDVTIETTTTFQNCLRGKILTGQYRLLFRYSQYHLLFFSFTPHSSLVNTSSYPSNIVSWRFEE
ncbi:hypothetical protein YC2023_055176 [Brassica napus]